MITLEQGPWTATIAPEVGGAVASLTHAGRSVLRPTPEGATDPLQYGCFPLVPFANRVRDGHFTSEGRAVSLETLPAFRPHALHGQGWLQPWRVVERSAAGVVLGFDGGGDDWPWPYAATQTLSLTVNGLRIDLEATNTGAEPMPCGLGLHPYFPVGPNASIEAATTGVWVGADIVPDRLAPSDAVFDWTGRRITEAPFVDRCYEGWSGAARLVDDDGGTVVRASADRLHVYAPKGETFCCLEPVTHRPDVFNQARPGEEGFVVLRPGETQSMWMTISRDQ